MLNIVSYDCLLSSRSIIFETASKKFVSFSGKILNREQHYLCDVLISLWALYCVNIISLQLCIFHGFLLSQINRINRKRHSSIKRLRPTKSAFAVCSRCWKWFPWLMHHAERYFTAIWFSLDRSIQRTKFLIFWGSLGEIKHPANAGKLGSRRSEARALSAKNLEKKSWL